MKTTVTPIFWRTRSQAAYLPPSDKSWSRVCEVRESGPSPTIAGVIMRALNRSKPSDHFEYKLGKPESGGPKQRHSKRFARKLTTQLSRNEQNP